MKRKLTQCLSWIATHKLSCAGSVVGVIGVVMLCITSPSGNSEPSFYSLSTEASAAKEPLPLFTQTQVDLHVCSANERRQDALQGTIAQIDRDLKKIAAEIKADLFTEDMLSWNSKFQMVGGSEAHRQWVRQRFEELVINPYDLKLVLQQRSQQLQAELVRIDNELLITLQKDVETELPIVTINAIDLRPIDLQIQAIVEHAEQAVWSSVTELVVTTGVSTVTGNAASAFFETIGERDEYGNPTMGNAIGSLLGGLVVGLATDVAISEAINIQGELKATVENEVNLGLQQLFVGASGADGWIAPLQKLIVDHQAACEHAIRVWR